MCPTLQPTFQQNFNILQSSKGEGKVTERTSKKDVQEFTKTFTSCGEVLLTVQCKHNDEEISPVHPCPRNPLLQTLTWENTHQSCSQRGGRSSLSAHIHCFHDSIQLEPFCRTSAFSFCLPWQGNVVLDIDLEPISNS